MMPWSLGFPPQGCGSSTVGGSPQHVPRKLLGEESQETPVTFWAPLKDTLQNTKLSTSPRGSHTPGKWGRITDKADLGCPGSNTGSPTAVEL